MNILSTGKVIEVKDGIAVSDGLSEIGSNELVNIQTNDGVLEGMAVNLEESKTGIIVLGDYTKVKQGDKVVVTKKLPSIKVNKNYLGRVIDALGNPIDGKGEIDLSDSKEMLLEKVAPGIIEREDVSRPLQTGILAIDALVPIGLGQRELIIGDRQTGKTTIAVDTLINLKDQDVYGIYVTIGQKSSKTANLIAKLEEAGVMNKCIVVAASASMPSAMQYLSAFTGTAIGEYFAENGMDAVIIYDDLTKHAGSYREVSLLLRRPSGREAYPGDIFYLHSRLLERSIQYSKMNGGGSLTALPIIETQAGDLSAYIPTNVISITDGQIFLETDLFNSGLRPAVSIGASVSRVGGSAQTKAMKQVAGPLKLDMAQYRDLAAFSQFGSEIDESTKKFLDKGARITELLKQNQNQPRNLKLMIILIYAVTQGFLDSIPTTMINSWEKTFEMEFLHSELSNKIDVNQKIEGDIEKDVEEYIKESVSEFSKLHLEANN